LIAESKMRQWTEMSIVQEYDGDLYYTTQAGFFRADSDFTRAVFVCGDGPESGMPFKISHGKVFFRRGALTGGGGQGLYCMELDGTGKRLLYGGDVSSFDYDGDMLYFSDMRDGSLFMLDISGAEVPKPAPLGENGGMSGDSVICYTAAGLVGSSAASVPADAARPAGGFIARRHDKKYDLYYHSPDGSLRRLTEGGSGIPRYFNGRLLYSSWTAENELRHMDLRALK
jgi:hypothetical protein